MESLRSMADSGYTGFCEITDRNVLDLQCNSVGSTRSVDLQLCEV